MHMTISAGEYAAQMDPEMLSASPRMMIRRSVQLGEGGQGEAAGSGIYHSRHRTA